MRGDVHRLTAAGRHVVVVQSDDLVAPTVLVAPTSSGSRPGLVRPTIVIDGEPVQLLVEQVVAVDAERLGPYVGHVGWDELQQIGTALRLVFALD